jgi:hypothetical protein
MTTNDETLLARASRDKSLGHGAFRLLALLNDNPDLSANAQQRLRTALGVCSLAQWLDQLRSSGYLPPVKRRGFEK